MKRPFLLRTCPDRLRLSLWSRLYRTKHKDWAQLYQSASLKYAQSAKMELVPGDIISDSIAFTGIYEPTLTKRVIELARLGGTLVDVGANLGYFSLLWAAAKPSNKCIAFEASPRNISMLRRNVQSNGFDGQIKIIPCAAGSATGRLNFDPGNEGQTGWGGLTLQENEHCIEVEVIRVDQIIASDDPISLLKVDIEGADTWALMGCERLLSAKAIREIWYEENKPRMSALGIAPEAPQEYLRSVGYVSTAYNDVRADLVEWSAVPEPKYTGGCHMTHQTNSGQIVSQTSRRLDRLGPANQLKNFIHLYWQPITLIFFGIMLGLLIWKHEPWRDETQAWQLAVHSDSLTALFQNIRYEGHPILWFLMLRELHAVFDSTDVLFVIHWLIATVNGFLVIYFCPLPPWQRLACCFGYFMMFEYGLIARDYALTVLLAFLFVVTQTRNPRRFAWPTVILALLSHASVPGGLLAISLLTYWVTDVWGDGVDARVRIAVAAALVLLSVTIMSWYLSPPLDSTFANSFRDYRRHLNPGEVIANSRLFLRAALPFARLDTWHFWNTNWTDTIQPKALRTSIQYPATLLCLLGATLSLVHRFSAFILFATGTLLVGGFAILHGQTAMRHQGQWFILLLLCYWLDRRTDLGTHHYGSFQQRVRVWFPAVLFAVQPLALFTPLARSIQYSFSPTKELANQVKKLTPHLNVLGAYPDGLVSPISFAFGSSVYSPDRNSVERFTVWKDPAVQESDRYIKNLSRALLSGTANDTDLPLLLFMNSEDLSAFFSKLPAGISATQFVSLPDGIVADEANVAILIQKKPR